MIIPSKSKDAPARAGYHAAERGYWLGSGVTALGMVEGAQVEPGHLRQLLDGRHPLTGANLLQRRRAGRVVCQEELYCAPKSVSLAALRLVEGVDAEVVQDAHRIGVHAAWAEMARLTRGRRFGDHRGCPVHLVAAVYEHTSSRMDDPHLNSHLLIANLALKAVIGDEEPRWVALEKNAFCYHRNWFTTIYRNALARHLSSHRIGWEAVGEFPSRVPELTSVSAEERERHSKASRAVAKYKEEQRGLPPALLALRKLRLREAKTEPEVQLPGEAFYPTMPPSPKEALTLTSDAGQRPGAIGDMVRAVVTAAPPRRPRPGERHVPAPMTFQDLLWRGYCRARAEQSGRNPASGHQDFLHAALQAYLGVAHLDSWHAALTRANQRLLPGVLAGAEEVCLQTHQLRDRHQALQLAQAMAHTRSQRARRTLAAMEGDTPTSPGPHGPRPGGARR